MEARVYAEDPYRNFLPSIGRLSRYRPPAEGPDGEGGLVRVDAGVQEGGEISIHYDPMIAKLCTYAPTRLEAIDALARALDQFELEGIGHNLPFLAALADHERFRAGRLTTAFIAEEYEGGFTGVPPTEADLPRLAAVAAVVVHIRQQRDSAISGAMDNHRRAIGRDFVATLAGRALPFTIDAVDGGYHVVFADGALLAVASRWAPGQALGRFSVGGEAMAVKIGVTAGGLRLRWHGRDVLVQVRSPRVAELARLMREKIPPDTSKLLLCPMPGVVAAITVSEGEAVEAGQALATIEAMKMENVLRAEKAGTISRIAVAEGASLAVDELILEFE
jgi:propionyl-CoA carboxylase alpha chain